MTNNNTDRFVWLDLETFGLNPHLDPIVEIGFKITDIDLLTIDDFKTPIWTTPWYDTLYRQLRERAEAGDTQAQWVLDTHHKSGLWEDASSHGLPPEDALRKALDWLGGHGVDRGDPICGSSLRFDRDMLASWLPEVDQLFSYRVIDVSSLKETCMRENPEVYAQLEEELFPRKLHRVLEDIDDTIREYRFYRDNLLRVEHAH